MSVLRLLLIFVVLAAWGGQSAQADERAGGSGTVAEIVDGDTLILNDGREIRLVGIQAPKLPLGRRGFVKWPLADEAQTALAELALGRQVDLRFTGRERDRHGRWLAHLHRDDGLWLQGAMLARGMARVYSFPDNRGRIAEMINLERTARAARRGIWADPFYAVRRPDEAADHIDTFQLVEGRVLSVAVVRGRGYLNFGSDWKTDFTVSVAPEAMPLFERAGVAIEAYEDRIVRVRGWLKSWNGPMIEASHPEQIELFD